jgi:FMN-dependent NADH-azoreductase
VDFLTPYLRYVLATIGLRNVSVLRLTGLSRGETALAQADADAAGWIEAATADWKRTTWSAAT